MASRLAAGPLPGGHQGIDIPSTMVLPVARFLLLSCLCALGACAATPASPPMLRARVHAVLDGDTFHARPSEGTFPKGAKRVHDSLVSVRLEGIDAPEKDQPWGDSSRAALGRLIAGATIEIEVVTIDKYRRIVGRVHRDDLVVNARMVGEGHAWMFRRYTTSPELDSLETDARDKRRGLWSSPAPIEPSLWRRRGKRSEN